MNANSKIQELLARARANLAAKQEQEAADAALALATQIDDKGVRDEDISFDKAGISNSSLETPEGKEAAVEFIQEVARNIAKGMETEQSNSTTIENDAAKPEAKQYGVAKDVILNNKQNNFLTRVLSGTSCVLIGAAGTGKTTSMRETTRQLIEQGSLRELDIGTKWLKAGSPGAAILSFTRKAVNNIKHAVVEELKGNTITVHKLLEFQPVFYEIDDPSTAKGYKTTMAFEPTRNEGNPLPEELTLLVFEESSMVSVPLYDQVQNAMPHKHQEIFLGDINQLPPVFGQAVLGFKMLELPVIELTEVYRQALESPIINLAWSILRGEAEKFSSKKEEFKEYNEHVKKEVTKLRIPSFDEWSRSTEAGTVKLQPWQKKLPSEIGCNTFIKQMCAWEEQGYYDPSEDIILCPYNKSFGTEEINKGISNYLALKRNAEVYEVIAGFDKHYLAVGDRVLYDKEDAFIIAINHNGNYMGNKPQPHSKHLDRWGTYQKPLTAEELAAQEDDDTNFDVEAIENFMQSAIDNIENRVQAASHVVRIRMAYGEGEEYSLDNASEINNLLGGYAITVHKAQGSEYDKVFFVMQHSHAVMNQRELLYTAVTRAKNFLHVICEPDTFEKGIASQKIEGNTLEDKAKWFNAKGTGPKKRTTNLGTLNTETGA